MTIFSNRPGRAFAFILFIAACALAGGASFAQKAGGPSASSAAGQTLNGAGQAGDETGTRAPVTDETRIMLDDTGLAEAASGATKTPSSIWLLVRALVVLALVIAAIYGIFHVLKKTSTLSAASDPYLKSVSSIPLAPGKTAQVISIGTRAFLVGCADQQISLIAELDDRELIDAMNLASERKVPPAGGFASILSSFLPGKAVEGNKGGTGFSGWPRAAADDSAAPPAEPVPESGIATADFLRRQRERLREASAPDRAGAPAGGIPAGGISAGRPETER